MMEENDDYVGCIPLLLFIVVIVFSVYSLLPSSSYVVLNKADDVVSYIQQVGSDRNLVKRVSEDVRKDEVIYSGDLEYYSRLFSISDYSDLVLLTDKEQKVYYILKGNSNFSNLERGDPLYFQSDSIRYSITNLEKLLGVIDQSEGKKPKVTDKSKSDLDFWGEKIPNEKLFKANVYIVNDLGIYTKDALATYEKDELGNLPEGMFFDLFSGEFVFNV